MKKILTILLIASFLFVGCATNRTMQGAGIGAGAGGLASIIAGKSGTTSALLIMGGALVGGLIGNTMDELDKQAIAQSKQYPNENVTISRSQPSNANTQCNKVTKKTWKNGTLISETTEEVCRGERQSNTYE